MKETQVIKSIKKLEEKGYTVKTNRVNSHNLTYPNGRTVSSINDEEIIRLEKEFIK